MRAPIEAIANVLSIRVMKLLVSGAGAMAGAGNGAGVFSLAKNSSKEDKISKISSVLGGALNKDRRGNARGEKPKAAVGSERKLEPRRKR